MEKLLSEKLWENYQRNGILATPILINCEGQPTTDTNTRQAFQRILQKEVDNKMSQVFLELFLFKQFRPRTFYIFPTYKLFNEPESE